MPVTGTVGDNITSLPNTTISIKCPASGVPRPVVSWTKDGEPVIDGKHITLTDQGTLIISSTKVEDNGRYKCTVKNRDGEDRASTQLNITSEFACMKFTIISRSTVFLSTNVATVTFGRMS